MRNWTLPTSSTSRSLGRDVVHSSSASPGFQLHEKVASSLAPLPPSRPSPSRLQQSPSPAAVMRFKTACDDQSSDGNGSSLQEATKRVYVACAPDRCSGEIQRLIDRSDVLVQLEAFTIGGRRTTCDRLRDQRPLTSGLIEYHRTPVGCRSPRGWGGLPAHKGKLAQRIHPRPDSFGKMTG